MPAKYTLEQQIAAFWSRVDTSGGTDACWNWTASCDQTGYGHMRWNGKIRKSSRIAYELSTGVSPGELHVLHTCDNQRCVNPRHLFLGTHQDNMHDRDAKGRGNQAKGEQNGQSKLADIQVAEIRRRYAAGGIFQRELASEFGVYQSTISAIVLRKTHGDNQSLEKPSWWRKLTDIQVAEIRQRYAIGGISQTALAHEYGVGQAHISRIIRGTAR